MDYNIGKDLNKDEYYEARHIGTKARTDKTCSYCGGNIPKGQSHDMHHFYPEFYAYPTHDKEHSFNGDKTPEGQKSCSESFIESLN